MFDESSLKGLVTALGIGLMIGVVRERRHEPDASAAGIRTHALISILGAVSWNFGVLPFSIALIVVGAFAVTSYLKTASRDPGLTGEVTIVLTFCLAALAMKNIYYASALGVLCTILIQAKSTIHRWSREIISEQEISDGLLILAALLIVNPLLPGDPIDPWGVLKLSTVWRIVVLLMSVGMAGHIARRVLGARLGLPIAGFFSGFASSTAAVATFGERAKHHQTMVFPSAACALLANVASLILFIGVLATVAGNLLSAIVLPLGLAIATLTVFSLFLLLRHTPSADNVDQSSGQSFKLSHALLIAGVISFFSLLSAWLNDIYGSMGALASTTIVALAEVHAAAASLGQLATSGTIDIETAKWGVIAALFSSALAKIVLAWLSGGKKYCVVVGSGLMLMIATAIAGLSIRV